MMQDRWLIVGLGNPGKKYERTWHNLGYMTLDVLAQRHGVEINKMKFKGLYQEARISGRKAVLLLPETFMNLSGNSVVEALNFYKIPTENLIVIYDDIDIELGKIRIRKAGGPGSHNGMKSVISRLGSEDFIRIRVGFGPQDRHRDMIEKVLSSIPKADQKAAFEGLCKAADAVELILAENCDLAMNKLNGV